MHNKERCTALGECVCSSSDFVHESGVRMVRLRARAYSGACRWLEGLCTVLNRIVEAHDKRGALHTDII